jgi:RHS repeat-associated protein
MPTVRYTVVDGELIAEERGGVRRQFVPDPLGSTVALLDNSQTKTDTFAHWPYGEEQSRTGKTNTPFRYVGVLGYYRDSAALIYVRARYLNVVLGRWLTQDSIWSGHNPSCVL